MRRRHLTSRGRRPGAAPRHPPHREGSPGVGRVDGSGVSSSDPPRPLEDGPIQATGGEGMSRAAGHWSCAAVAQTLLAGTGGGWGHGGGQWVGQVALPPHLTPEARQFIDLGQRRQVHDVVVSVGAEVGRALARLVAVLQKDGSPGLVRSPAAFVVGPFPVDAAAEAGGLGEQGPAHGARLS